MEEDNELKTFAEWWDALERNGTELAAAPFLKPFSRSKKLLTFEEFADLCVKILDHEAQRGNDLGRITSSTYFKDLIRKDLTHLSLCKMIEQIVSLSAAIAFHEEYVEIERNRGLDEAIEFQRTESKKFGVIPPEQISITIKGDEVIITF